MKARHDHGLPGPIPEARAGDPRVAPAGEAADVGCNLGRARTPLARSGAYAQLVLERVSSTRASSAASASRFRRPFGVLSPA